MPAKIRPYLPGDTAGMLRVHGQAILAIDEAVYRREELESWNHGKVEDAYLRAMEAGETYLIAEDAGEVVGFCGYKRHPDGVGEICGLYVAPAHQDQAIGSRLLRQAEGLMASQGATRFLIEASLAALPFYLKAGYRVTAEMRHQTRGGLPLEIRRVERIL